MRRLGSAVSHDLLRAAAVGNNALTSAATVQARAAAITAGLRRLQRELRGYADQLAAITPPAAVRAPHAQLRRGLLEYASGLDRIIGLVGRGNFAALQQISALPGATLMVKASNAITAKGYEIVKKR
jgi:hypothetical protein